MSCIGCLYHSAWYTNFVSPPTKPSTVLHPATLLLCACLRQRTRLVYAYVLLTHVSYFSRGPKLSSENGPSLMWDLGHGTICRSPCEHQQPTSLTGFKSALNTHLFRCCYPTCWTYLTMAVSSAWYHYNFGHIPSATLPFRRTSFVGCHSFHVQRHCHSFNQCYGAL